MAEFRDPPDSLGTRQVLEISTNFKLIAPLNWNVRILDPALRVLDFEDINGYEDDFWYNLNTLVFELY